MLIVNCIGGLGNQMFQYAYYWALSKNYNNVYFTTINFKSYSLHNGYELDKIFNFAPNMIDDKKINQLKNAIISKILTKLKLYQFNIIQNNFAYDIQYAKFYFNHFLIGYWQSEKYFANCKLEIRKQFTFPNLDTINLQIAMSIQNSTAISLHVRRGDYVNHDLHGNLCNLDYYKQAIDIVIKKTINPIFYIFSDDIKWCQDNFSVYNFIYITNNNNTDSYKDMHLMSLCKHNIIANSSFSWWGAWLNNNPNKIVIAPKKWFNDNSLDTKDLLPDTWIKI